MLNLQHVESLLAVLTAGSFHEAARRSGRSQPTLTQHIQKLEAELGVQLLVRGGVGGCLPTPAGETFLPLARSLLRTAERAREAVHGRRFAIGASSNIGVYLLPPILARLAATGLPLPDIQIDTNLQVANRLEQGEIDLAIMEWWDGRDDFTATVWREEPLVVIVAPSHRWAGRLWIDKEELCQEQLIGGESGTGTGRILSEALGEIQHRLRLTLTLGSTEAVKNAVQCGLGVSIVMAGAVEGELAAGTLVGLPIRGVSLAKKLVAVAPTDLPRRTPAHALLSLLQGTTLQARI